MKTYTVTIMRTSYAYIHVEAETKDDAEAKAWEKYQESDAHYCAENEISDVEENMERIEE